MTSINIEISDLSSLDLAGKELLKFAGNVKVFAFNGEMGAGKTTFIKTLCKVLGSNDDFSSPTYSIVNEYKYREGRIFHFDLYRLKSVEELFDIGFEEYINSGNYCFIEWPDLAESLLPIPHLSIIINQNQNNRYLSACFTE